MRASGLYDALIETGQLVPATLRRIESLDPPPDVPGAWVLEHEAIPFITYPYEWSFTMLRDAALLTLDVLERALAHDFVLKDATPFNVQFRDAKPVFIDILSFEPYEANAPWVGYNQFCSMFLFPLMLTAYRGVEFHPFVRGTLGTLRAVDMSRLFGWRDAWRPGVLTHVKLAARFQKGFEHTDAQLTSRFAEIQFSKEMLLGNVRGLRRTLGKVRYGESDSAWNRYASDNTYSETEEAAKRAFVTAAVEAEQPGVVWDLGCNVGVYSEIAAQAGARVVAIDGDPASVDRLYRAQQAGDRSPRIQPMVGDLANPSPAMGWSLAERRSWAGRGQADMFLALALVHHLVITANIPVAEFVRFLRRVAPAGVTEFVTKDDPMVQRLLANRRDVFDDYRVDQFEAALLDEFRIAQREVKESGTRVLYHLASK